VLSIGVLGGVVLGVALSLAWLVYVTTAPAMPLLGRERRTAAFRELDAHPADETFPGIVVMRLDGGLFFATADALHERLRAVMEGAGPELRAVVLDLGGVDFVNSQGTAKLAELSGDCLRDGVVLRLAHVKTGVLHVLAADGVLERLGADRVHAGLNHAVEAQLAIDDAAAHEQPAGV
jgi:SulP family sulfate permease